MAIGEVSGNQSVHWRIDHQTGNLGINQGNPNRPTGNHQVNTAGARAQGRDPKNVNSVIGSHPGARNGYFGVRLRFESAAEADAAFKDAMSRAPVPGVAPGFYVVVEVKALNKPTPDDSPAEVKIEW
jgi:hypothetical protein